MDIVKLLNKEFNNKYDFLKLYEVTYNPSLLECVLTFLYPQNMENLSREEKDEIRKFLTSTLNLNADVVVKFKKSFLDNRLFVSEILKFINDNYKSIAVYLKENQIEINDENNTKNIKLHLGKEVFKYFENSNVSNKLGEYLIEKFISTFEISAISDENFKINDTIGDVEAPILFKKNHRYKVFTVHNLFGGDIAPEPEFIKDNNAPKTSVIFAGKIENFQKKTFTRKKGKREGEEGTYYTFTLNDDKKIDCVYFCPKSNLKKMDFLTNDMTILCLGDLKVGLSNKLTYYIKRVAVATIDEQSKIIKPENLSLKHKNTVEIEDYFNSKQENIFEKKIEYNDYIMSNTFVVYDLETTGIDPTTDKIIEIGAIKIENGKLTKKFSTFVDPEMHIPEEASKINNITDDMVKGAPKLLDAILDFLKFTEGAIISGYNNINFDNKFINKACKDSNLEFANETVDVFNLARLSDKVHSKNYKLKTVCDVLNVSLEGAHRAYNDAIATAQVLLKLNEKVWKNSWFITYNLL